MNEPLFVSITLIEESTVVTSLPTEDTEDIQPPDFVIRGLPERRGCLHGGAGEVRVSSPPALSS